MTRDDIVRMAMEAGFAAGVADSNPSIERFVALVAKHEREQCAVICEQKIERPADYQGRFGGYGNFMGDKTGLECAIEIRARGAR